MDTPTGNYSNRTVLYASNYLTEQKPNRVMSQLHEYVTFKLKF